ncbi:MAG: hypothetical protein ACXACI_12115 [Candidatus Hodarchaeales archaeon]|jgi:hypothetical protein
MINEGGLPVVDVPHGYAASEVALFSGLTIALQTFAEEVSGGKQFHSLDFEGYSLIFSPVSGQNILVVKMSEEMERQREIRDLVMESIISCVEEALPDVGLQVMIDTQGDRLIGPLSNFLDLGYLNDLLGPHGYQIRPLNRAVCYFNIVGDTKVANVADIPNYHWNLTEAEVQGILEEILPKMSLLSTQSGEHAQNTVFSFPKIKRIGLVSLISHKDPDPKTGQPIRSALIVVFDEIDEMVLYRHSSAISKRLAEVPKRLMETKGSYENVIAESIPDLLAMGRFRVESTIRKIDPDTISFDLLLKTVKKRKDLDRLLRNLLVGKQVVLAGDVIIAKTIAKTLEAFAIHRGLIIKEGAVASEKSTADIVTTNEDWSSYRETDTVILDIDNVKVIGGSSSKFCQKLLKTIEKTKDIVDAIAFIEGKITKIVTHATTLVDMAQAETGEIPEDRLREFKEQLADDELEIVTEIALATSPLISENILKTSEAIQAFESYLLKF